jgi:2-polyprenyl-3-methyl-5-hydroxy-6-metoxy-1,4-benzoquinol methylase
MHSAKAPGNTFQGAVSEMLELWKANDWFVRSYWPENRPRVERMLRDLQRTFPKGRIFEPGCGNGYISFLAARLGYEVMACDSWFPPDREELFAISGVQCFSANLNHLNPWPQLADATFDAVLFGEVFEHILNHPLGLLREIRRVLKPAGMLILTTPNPATLANAIRFVRGSYSLWGTHDFAVSPKIADGAIIDKGEIHYREYRQDELRRLLQNAGFEVAEASFITTGSQRNESLFKRALKATPLIRRQRLFGSGHYIVSRAL